jgi:hypothetical protein
MSEGWLGDVVVLGKKKVSGKVVYRGGGGLLEGKARRPS